MILDPFLCNYVRSKSLDKLSVNIDDVILEEYLVKADYFRVRKYFSAHIQYDLYIRHFVTPLFIAPFETCYELCAHKNNSDFFFSQKAFSTVVKDFVYFFKCTQL